MRTFLARAILIAILLGAVAVPSNAFAADEDIPYGVRMPYRIVRGVTNIALGWTEIFIRPFAEHENEGIGEALSMGGANTLIRLGVGLTDITTFWVPDIQMPDMYPDSEPWPYLFQW